jgi:hypothetical protein
VSIGISLRAVDAGKMTQHYECQKLSIARLFAGKLLKDFVFGSDCGVSAHPIFDSEFFALQGIDIESPSYVRGHSCYDAFDLVPGFSDGSLSDLGFGVADPRQKILEQTEIVDFVDVPKTIVMQNVDCHR